MNKAHIKNICLFLGLVLVSPLASAEIIQVFGSGQIVAPHLGSASAISPGGVQCGYTEARCEVLAEDLIVDGGSVIAAGTCVDRHLIFQNQPGGGLSYARATWQFDGEVLGTISVDGALPVSGLEASSGDYVSVRANRAMVVSVVNWLGDSADWVRVITASVDSDGDGVSNTADDYVNSDTRDTVIVLGIDTGIPNDIVLVAPDGSELNGVFLADIVNAILDEALAAAQAEYETDHGDHDHDDAHRDKKVKKDFAKGAKKALKVWEKADILLKDEAKVIEKILKMK